MARTATTLVIGGTAAAREQAIAALLAAAQSIDPSAAGAVAPAASPPSSPPSSPPPSLPPASAGAPSPGLDAVILEGLGVAATPLENGPALQVSRIAPGCLCCDGNLVLRVTLNRLLRQRPRHLYIGLSTGLASSEHLDQLRSWLAAPPYDQLLALNPTVHA